MLLVLIKILISSYVGVHFMWLLLVCILINHVIIVLCTFQIGYANTEQIFFTRAGLCKVVQGCAGLCRV